VGEDLDFQRRWWRFERIIWSIFALILLCDVLEVFGRGYFAKAERSTVDRTMHLKYERVEREHAPSIMSISFGPSAIRNGEIRLFISESVVKELGAERIIPEPASSKIGNGGITYIFPATAPPATVDIALSPSRPGIHDFTAGVEGAEMVKAKVTVFP